MKKTILIFFVSICSFGFAQQQKQGSEYINRTQYFYTILNVDNEQILEQLVNEISVYKGVIACKYRVKPEKKMAEIVFTFNERQKQGEGDKGEPLPNVKKLILDKGLEYNGFTFQTEKNTN